MRQHGPPRSHPVRHRRASGSASFITPFACGAQVGRHVTTTIDPRDIRHSSGRVRMSGIYPPDRRCIGRPADAGDRITEAGMRYAMFICMDPEATATDEAAAPSIDGWFDHVIGKGEYLQGIRL